MKLTLETINYMSNDLIDELNHLLEIIDRATLRNAKIKDICNILRVTGTEISMKYNPKFPTKCTVGDIVDCNFGASGLKNELSGRHVYAVICDIDDNGLVYAVPITKAKIAGDATKYLQLSNNIQAEYINSKFNGGTVLLKMGRYIHHLRVNEVVGHALPEFFGNLLRTLPSAVDFYAKYSDEETETEHPVEEK